MSDDQPSPSRVDHRWPRWEQLQRNLEAGSSNARIRDNPYLFLLKFGCISTGILGLLMQLFGPGVLALSYWLLTWAGLSLIGYLVICALLWPPPPAGNPGGGSRIPDDSGTPPTNPS